MILRRNIHPFQDKEVTLANRIYNLCKEGTKRPTPAPTTYPTRTSERKCFPARIRCIPVKAGIAAAKPHTTPLLLASGLKSEYILAVRKDIAAVVEVCPEKKE